jgi:hypothetical protein
MSRLSQRAVADLLKEDGRLLPFSFLMGKGCGRFLKGGLLKGKELLKGKLLKENC